MEQKLRFGRVLGRLAVLKINVLADYEQLLSAVFSCFHGHKQIFIFSKNIYSFTFFEFLLIVFGKNRLILKPSNLSVLQKVS